VSTFVRRYTSNKSTGVKSTWWSKKKFSPFLHLSRHRCSPTFWVLKTLLKK